MYLTRLRPLACVEQTTQGVPTQGSYIHVGVIFEPGLRKGKFRLSCVGAFTCQSRANLHDCPAFSPYIPRCMQFTDSPKCMRMPEFEKQSACADWYERCNIPARVSVGDRGLGFPPPIRQMEGYCHERRNA